MTKLELRLVRACWLAAYLGGIVSCAQPHAELLKDARAASGCESVRYVTKEDEVYVVEGCGKTLRMRCLSDWSEPWCCHPEGTPSRTDCGPEDPTPQTVGTDKPMPGFNAPQ